MPVYNTGTYVEAAVRSILVQTLRDFELIIIDDGSTDGAGEQLQQLAAQDPRIRLTCRPNTGYTRALQEALTYARAPLIARMDSDDLSHPQRLEKQLAFLDAHPDIAVVGTAWNLLRPNNTRHPPSDNDIATFRAGPDAVATRLAQGHNIIAHPSVVFRRAAFDAAGGYEPAYEPAEDFECWLRMSRTQRLAVLPEILIDYRHHPASVCATRGRESADAVTRALQAHWQSGHRPPGAARAAVHRHLALMHRSVGAYAPAAAHAMRALAAAPGSWGNYRPILQAVRHRLPRRRGPLRRSFWLPRYRQDP